MDRAAETHQPLLPRTTATERPIRHAVTLAGKFNTLLDGKAAWYGAITILIALQCILTLNHAPWLDEYQALQIAIQSPDLAAMFENLRYEGHAPLWYLVLRPLSAIMPPSCVLPAAQLPIALAIQAVILTRSEYSRLERLMIALSPLILFEYGVLSRSLSLGVLLTLMAFAWRGHRRAWVAVALLPMTDFLFGILSIGWLTVIWLPIAWRERRFSLAGLGAWLISSLIAAWTVRPATDMVPALAMSDPLVDAIKYLVHLSPLLIPLPLSEGTVQWNSFVPLPFGIAAGMAFPWFCWLCTRRIRLHAIVLMGMITITAMFSILVYPLPIRHLSLIVLLLIILVGIGRQQGVREPALFRIWLGVMALGGLLVAATSLSRPFDTAANAVDWIRAHHLERAHWAVFPDSRAQGISARTGIEFERIESGCTQSFIRWNYRSRIETNRQLFTLLGQMRDRHGSFYLLSDTRYPVERVPHLIRLIQVIPEGYDGQPYLIYHVGPDRPASRFQVPQCAPRRLPMPRWEDAPNV